MSSDDYDDMRDAQLESLKKTMRPEFINRIDEVIVFHKLNKENMYDIASIMIDGLCDRLRVRNISITVEKEAKEFIVNHGYNSEYGARPLRRSVQKLIEDELSERILLGTLEIGEDIVISLVNNALEFSKKKIDEAEKLSEDIVLDSNIDSENQQEVDSTIEEE